MPVEVKFINFLHAIRLHRGLTHGNHSQVHEQDNRRAHEIFQSSTINALARGAYDGDMTYGQLREYGNFGLGTFNSLDGEMIALDGIFYQIKSDGLAYPVDNAQKTPFAVVQFFKPDFNNELEQEMEYDQLKNYLNTMLPTSNLFYAIRIDGFFTHVEVRSVPRQIQPYPPLDEVLKTQSVFELFNVEGTLAGFRFPDYALGINEPGYHLHFITKERNKGGHVFELQIQRGKIAVEHTSNFYMELPGNGNILDNDIIKDPEKQTTG